MPPSLRRVAGLLILVIAPIVTAVVGVAAFLLAALVSADPWVLCLSGLAVALLAAFALALPGWALVRRPRIRGAATAYTCLVVAVCAASFSLAVLVPGPRPSAGPAPSGVAFWTLRTGSRIAYIHRPATGRPRPYPVLFLHGGPGTPGEGLPAVASGLSAAGFDVYAYDQLGAGRSTRLRDVRGYTVARQVADLEAIRVLLGVDRLILVGQSWGGSLAAQYVAAHPRQVHQVVFTSPGPIWPRAWPDGGGGDPWARLSAEQKKRRDAVVDRPRVLAQALLQRINPNAAHRLVGDDEADEMLHRVAVLGKDATACPGSVSGPVHGNHQGFYVNQNTVADFETIADPRPALRTAAVPTLIMRGSCDFVPWPVTREYRDLVPGAVLVAIPGAGHGIAAGQPALYAQLLQAFLTGGRLPLPPYTAEAPPPA